MSKRDVPKYRISRRITQSLWGRSKDPANVRNYPPGQHGPQKAQRKPKGNYGMQLEAMQKLRYYYNIMGKQFALTFRRAARKKGNTGENLIGLLESRLDAIVYRSTIVPTIFAARQFVSHGHVLVDGKKVNIPSYIVRPGQVVEVRQKSKQLAIIAEALASKERTIPEYLNFNDKDLSIEYIRVPLIADVPYAVVMEPNLVIEFYSK